MLAAIGDVATECARVEDDLRELYCYLIDSAFGRVILAGESLSAGSLACLRAARYNSRISSPQLDRVVKISAAIKTAGEYRNFVVHSKWEKLDQPGEHYGVQSRRATTGPDSADTTKSERWTVSDVKQVSEMFRMIHDAIEALVDSLQTGPYVILVRRNVAERVEKFFSEMLGDFFPAKPDVSAEGSI